MAEHFCDLRRPLKIYTMAMVCLALLFSVWALPHSHPAVVAWLIAIFAAAAIVDPVPFPYGGTLHPIGGIIQFGALLWQPQDMLTYYNELVTILGAAHDPELVLTLLHVVDDLSLNSTAGPVSNV